MDFQTCVTSFPAILMEGALGERIKREFNIKIDGTVAMANLVYEEAGRIALKSLWEEYIGIARKYHLPFIATTPTRRANQERVKSAGYDESIILKNVEFLREIKETSHTEMYIGGLLGCKGDAYTGKEALSSEQAKIFHSWQINLFKDSHVDFLYAGIMPTLPEAIGMATAISETEIPYIISFTIQKDGKLIDGHSIDFAIRSIDNNVQNKPLGYMTNCAHPAIAHEALSQPFNRTEVVRARFIGIQANTSSLPYNELDGAYDLKESSPVDLAKDTIKLVSEFHLKIVGGCCGTDNRHMEEIANSLNIMSEKSNFPPTPQPPIQITEIRQLLANEYNEALDLSLEVFTECGKNDFDDEGLETFKSFIHNENLVKELTIYGAFDQDLLIGLIATKNEGRHISLFFIKPAYQGRGIGKRLFETAIQHRPVPEITVNSSSYAIPVYRKFGFLTTCEEQTTHGMKYTPMKRTTISQPYMEDYAELLALWESSVRSTHHFLKEEDILFYKELVPGYLPLVELYVIRNEKGRITAFMGLSEELIEMLFVHPKEQGKGLGKQLLDFALREKKIHKVDVNEQNTAALHFYQHLGYQVIGREETDASGKPFPILHLQHI